MSISEVLCSKIDEYEREAMPVRKKGKIVNEVADCILYMKKKSFTYKMMSDFIFQNFGVKIATTSIGTFLRNQEREKSKPGVATERQRAVQAKPESNDETKHEAKNSVVMFPKKNKEYISDNEELERSIDKLEEDIDSGEIENLQKINTSLWKSYIVRYEPSEEVRYAILNDLGPKEMSVHAAGACAVYYLQKRVILHRASNIS